MGIEVSNETLLGLLQAALGQTQQTDVVSFFARGKAYLVRTVTHYHTGRCVSVNEHEVVFEDAAWIADTGRWADTLKSFDPTEVEPHPGRVMIGRGAIVDAVEWSGNLPRAQK